MRTRAPSTGRYSSVMTRTRRSSPSMSSPKWTGSILGRGSAQPERSTRAPKNQAARTSPSAEGGLDIGCGPDGLEAQEAGAVTDEKQEDAAQNKEGGADRLD